MTSRPGFRCRTCSSRTWSCGAAEATAWRLALTAWYWRKSTARSAVRAGRVVVEGQGGDLGPVGPHEVLPSPVGAAAVAGEGSVVADHATLDAADAGRAQGLGQRLERREEAAVGVAAGEARVAAADQEHVAAEEVSGLAPHERDDARGGWPARYLEQRRGRLYVHLYYPRILVPHLAGGRDPIESDSVGAGTELFEGDAAAHRYRLCGQGIDQH